MAQGEKTAVQPSSATQNGGNNVVSLGPRDILQGRLEIQGDLKVGGSVEGELKATGDVTIDAGATIQAGIEGSNVSIRGQVTGNVLPPSLDPRHEHQIEALMGPVGRTQRPMRLGSVPVSRSVEVVEEVDLHNHDATQRRCTSRGSNPDPRLTNPIL